jgi:site-specific recombinase XerD
MKNNIPDGDVWNMKDNDIESQHYGRNFRFDFSYITSEEIKKVVKDYVWQNYIIKSRTLNSIYTYVKRLQWFNEFVENNNIKSLKELTNNDIDNFITYLHVTISERYHKPLSQSGQKSCLDSLKSIIYWCQLHKPDVVPDREIFTGNEYIGINRKLKIEFIPDDVLNSINEALKTEENPYVKYGIIILESTGMRIGDLLKLGTDCIKPHLISGYTITWFDHKNRKERPPMPVRSECAMAVDKVIEATKELRKETDDKVKNALFIHKPVAGKKSGMICVPTEKCFMNWFDNFIERNNIRSSDGELYNLTSHQFRRTLGTDMLSKGTNINVIQQVLGHADPSTTKLFYADIKDKERAETFKSIGIIGNINQLNESAFDNVTEMEWFKANKEKCVAGLCDGYCTKHLQDGKICDRLLKRQKCYTCSRYITTPEYLEAHKNHLASLERQVTEGAIYGEHYAEHFRPTIEVLKVIIERLEELQNDKN